MRRVLALALGLCLCASPALAAFTLSFQTSGFNSTGSVHSITSGNVTLGSGTLVVVTGDLVGLNASSDSAVVTDGAGNSYTVYQCPTSAGQTNISFLAWSVLTTGLTAQAVTVSDTTNAGTNLSASGAGQLLVWTLSGAAAASPEDTAVRACNGSTTATTSPTLTTGTPSQAGEFFISSYMSPSTNVSFSYSGDTTHGWTALGAFSGDARNVVDGDTQTNAGSGTKIDNPTTASRAYAINVMGFLPPAASSYGGGTTVGVGH